MFANLKKKALIAYCTAESAVKKRMRDRTGDLSTEKLGDIIFGVVIIGAIIAVAILAFPRVFENIINKLEAKLDALW